MTDGPIPRAVRGEELRVVMAAERAGEPFILVRVRGILTVIPLGLHRSRVTLGRHSGCDITLDLDEEISRAHAVFERVGSTWTISDDAMSRNGTYVNGLRTRGRQALADGDVVRFGGTVTLFRAPSLGKSGVVTRDAVRTITADAVTPAQLRVLRALCRPYKHGGAYAAAAPNQQIADELFISIESVKSHMKALFAKFGVEDLPQNQKRAKVVELAFTAGVVTERDL